VENEKDRIVGIKAIAEYLDTSIRNVHRWEKELDLPLRRVGGKRGRSVYVYLEELKEWFNKQEFANPNRKKEKKIHPNPLTIFAITLIALFAFVLYLIIGKKTPKSKINPALATYVESVIQIKNNEGDVLWSTVSYDQELFPGGVGYKCIAFFDSDNDGLNEVLTSTFITKDKRHYLGFFDHDGSQLWKRNMENEHRFNESIELKSDFYLLYVGVVKSKDNQLSILASWRHLVRFLSIITRYDLEGNLLDKYSHVGHLHKFEIYNLMGDKDPEIIISGTNNLLNGDPVVGVLPLKGFKGISPPYNVEPEFKEYEYRLNTYIPENPEPGNQLVYIRFKKTQHLKSYVDGLYYYAKIDNIGEKNLEVKVFPWKRRGDVVKFGFYYTMNHNFDLIDLIPNSTMSQHYDDFLKAKEVDVSLEELTTMYAQFIYKWDNGSWIPVKNYFLDKTKK
jgi:hypothetical protein